MESSGNYDNLFCLWNVIFGFKGTIVNVFWDDINYNAEIKSPSLWQVLLFTAFSSMVDITGFICVAFSPSCWVFLPSKMSLLHPQHWLRMWNVVGMPFSQYFMDNQTVKSVTAILPFCVSWTLFAHIQILDWLPFKPGYVLKNNFLYILIRDIAICWIGTYLV